MRGFKMGHHEWGGSFSPVTHLLLICPGYVAGINKASAFFSKSCGTPVVLFQCFVDIFFSRAHRAFCAAIISFLPAGLIFRLVFWALPFLRGRGAAGF